MLFKFFGTFYLLLFSISCSDVSTSKGNWALNQDEKKIHEIHDSYVNGWKSMDKEQVMSLFEANARIQPSSLNPIEGREKIRAFWFPADSSVTVIHDFTTENLNLTILDTLAICTRKTYLDWDYTKDSLQFGMVQNGISTTIYRKQPDSAWKIWRQMWTDIRAIPK